MIISPRDKDMDLNELKGEVKRICKTEQGVAEPRDVIMTKLGQIILKTGTRRESEMINALITGSEDLKDRVQVAIPRKRRERILVLSVDPAIEEQQITDTIRRVTEELDAGEGAYSGLRGKLLDPNLPEQTKTVLKETLSEYSHSFEIMKKIKTRNDKVNWLIDVDDQVKKLLLEKKRICVDYDRYRVVEFVNIVRCFKCQAFGHVASR